ncbi:hypothetical protein [Larkinella terrae]|uniref:Discoidin domain-containing protein n=1 Tax=Larkinella terrae TaxID=2025311 RepID=A0A7K0ESL8_9BACT|nr:hypothetical protein [Larkinella terrae]MRS64536.1 hypothetical protein [Larkinella terrae]
MIRLISFLFAFFTLTTAYAQTAKTVYPGADEKTPSMAMYFDWINRNWNGSNEQKTLKNLDFFGWMKRQYGMQLDVFLLDAGVFDNGPNCSSTPKEMAHGTLNSPWFRKAYPNGFNTIAQRADSIGTRLGLWIGPDGYGNTPEEAQQRVDLLANLCRDYRLKIFKMDACCSDLRPEKEPYFMQAMQRARQFSPDLIVLNHRISLSEEAKKYTTTFLWEGKETYIDVNNFNDATAIHHRQGNMKRGYPPNLLRLTEDHGICLSSALDFWEDDLILQAFNRSLILAPEIYGNPWLLRDDEFPTLARIYNLHRQYRSVLTEAIALPETNYGYKAVSRGNATTRFITLRNLGWTSEVRTLQCDSSIGLGSAPRFTVKQIHPTEQVIGVFEYGKPVPVEVQPFRSALFMVTAEDSDFSITGIDYKIIQDQPKKPLVVQLLGKPGTTHTVRIKTGNRPFTKARLDGKPVDAAVSEIKVSFPGKQQQEATHRKIGTLLPISRPSNYRLVYETMCFANDNNALEVRSLVRAGKTRYPEVQAARDAFFNDPTFVQTGSWDRYAFDGDTGTAFNAYASTYTKGVIPPGALRIDLQLPTRIDQLVLRQVPADYQPGSVAFSNDLVRWQSATTKRTRTDLHVAVPKGGPFRYIKMANAPLSVREMEGFYQNRKLPASSWKASNLFEKEKEAKLAWAHSFSIAEADSGSYLALAVPGNYKTESLFAAVRAGNEWLAPTDRSPSFPYNNWEHVDTIDGNVTFYFPVKNRLLTKPLTVTLYSTDDTLTELQPALWLTNYPNSLLKKELVLE